MTCSLLLVTLLLSLGVAQKKKKCKNGVECYLEAIKTIEEDTDFIKAKLGNGSSVGKLAMQVKEEMQEYTR